MGVGGEVQRIEVTERETPVFAGMEFGAVGPYERLHGTVYGELDPTTSPEFRHRQPRQGSAQRAW